MMLCLGQYWFSFEYLCSITMETFIPEEAFRKDFIAELGELHSEYRQMDCKQLKQKLPATLNSCLRLLIRFPISVSLH